MIDAVPLRKIPLNKVPFVPNNEPLLGILDKFQEGRSHMVIVSRFSVDKARVSRRPSNKVLHKESIRQWGEPRMIQAQALRVKIARMIQGQLEPDRASPNLVRTHFWTV